MKNNDWIAHNMHNAELGNDFLENKIVIYECAPIDDWRGWDSFFTASKEPFYQLTMNPISKGFFNALLYFLLKLSKTGNWDETIKDLYYNFNGQSLFFGLKMGCNGTTFICSNYPLMDIDFEYILDSAEDIQHTKQIFNNWPILETKDNIITREAYIALKKQELLMLQQHIEALENLDI